ncbi:MAG TPA: murein transglycosylase [Bacteroidetes bacterium]|nr:murein transglycosylase [Bacteroidota bacterium]HRK03652.1 lytic transglycosylase domain-containing protein [Chlorobiota bacterium]
MRPYLLPSIVVAGITVVILLACTDLAHGAGEDHVRDTLNIAKVSIPEKLSFCGEEVPMDIAEVRERVEREFYINLQTPGQIILYLKRSARYFPTFEKLLKEANAPDDLKYLSVAESALYMARSPKDAVGLWQFIPGTARAMGLLVNDDVDERRHIERSTRAAIAYLKSGYDSNGSWTNAAAGYNMGHGSFAENMRYQGKKDFYDIFLNEETSRYILRIAVIKHLMEQAHTYGIIVPEESRYAPEQTRVIRERSAISNLAQWATDHGSTYKDVKLLNPWILKRSLPDPPRDRTWEIFLPATAR